MIDELEKLRPEVRGCVEYVDDGIEAFGTSMCLPINRWQTIRAELLRLAAMEHAWQQWIKEGMRVEFLPPELPK